MLVPMCICDYVIIRFFHRLPRFDQGAYKKLDLTGAYKKFENITSITYFASNVFFYECIEPEIILLEKYFVRKSSNLKVFYRKHDHRLYENNSHVIYDMSVWTVYYKNHCLDVFRGFLIFNMSTQNVLEDYFE